MNPKIKKIDSEIEKTRKRLGEIQIKLRELEQQKTELENAEIIAAVRSIKATPEELAQMLSSLSKPNTTKIQYKQEDIEDEK